MINFFDRTKHINANEVTYVKEHLILQRNDCTDVICQEMYRQLQALTELADGELIRLQLVLQADGAFYRVTDFAAGFQQLLHALTSADQLELMTDYLLDSNTEFPNQVYTHLCKQESLPEEVFYGFYSTLSDGEEDPEFAAVYGLRNDRSYHGMLPYHVASMPEGHCWSTPWPAVVCEAIGLSPEVQQRCETIARELCTMSSGDVLCSDEDGFYFHLNGLEIHNQSELFSYIHLATELQKLTDTVAIVPQCTYTTVLTDITGADPIFLQLQEENGTYTTKFAIV